MTDALTSWSSEAAIEPLDRQASLGEQAYGALKASIIRGVFTPGEKLTVRSVAQALGVSTTPARDALNRLIAEGVLINLGPKTVVLPKLTAEALREVAAIRQSLEGLAAFEATARIDLSEIDRLEKVQDELNGHLDAGRYHDVLRVNTEFHFSIYRRSGMPRLVAIIESQWLRIGPSLHGLYPEYAQSRRGVSNHMWALNGLRDRDPAAVKAAIQNDIRGGFRRLSAWIAQTQGGA